MGKWAKSHTTAKKKGLTPKALKGIVSSAKDDLNPDVPGETGEEQALRNRQAMELAKLDDEENRRIKSMFAGGGSRKLFRNTRPSSSRSSSSAGSTGTVSSGGSAGSYVSGGGVSSGSRGSGSLIP